MCSWIVALSGLRLIPKFYIDFVQSLIRISKKMDYFHVQKLNELIDKVLLRPQLVSTYRKIALQYKFQNLQQPEEIKKLALKINLRMRKSLSSIGFEGIASGTFYKNWVLGEYKLFKIILAFYSIIHSIQISKMKFEHVADLQEIFRNKQSIIIEYEIAAFATENSKTGRKWNEEENKMLLRVIENNQERNWKEIAVELYELSDRLYFRHFAECREQWNNHLNPNVTKQQWTLEEDLNLLRGIEVNGFKWALLSKQMNGTRNQHMVKNRYNSIVRKLKGKGKKLDWRDEVEQIIRKLMNKQNILERKHIQTPQLEVNGADKLQGESMTQGSSNQLNRSESPQPIGQILFQRQFSIDDYLTLNTNSKY